jgi:uncharacterized protein YigE (DUF2233 family)
VIRPAALILALTAGAAAACESVAHAGRAFTHCAADLARQTAALRLGGADGTPLGGFAALERETAAPIAFAANAGMYHQDRRPVGLYVEDGAERSGIVTSAGPGNFGMLPNGVLCLTEGRAAVIESRAFAAAPPACQHATQSGPMLVVGGALHPRFIPGSPYLNVRNGVAASRDGRLLHHVISDEPVSFHDLATLFRDVLKVKDALYLDGGSASRLYAPGLGRADGGPPMGPILVVTEE